MEEVNLFFKVNTKSAFIGINDSRKLQINLCIYLCLRLFLFLFLLFFSQRLEIFNNAPHHTHQPPPPLPRRPLPDFGFRYSLLKVLLAGRKLVTSTWLAG